MFPDIARCHLGDRVTQFITTALGAMGISALSFLKAVIKEECKRILDSGNREKLEF